MSSLNKIRKANSLINTESSRLITWSLTIFGGSILVIISTDYINPSGCIKNAYYLFILGWILLGISIYYGQKVTRLFIASVTSSEEIEEKEKESDFIKGSKKIDESFRKQINCFKYGIFVFSIWLIAFLLWFILTKT